MDRLLHVQQLLALALQHLRHRDAGPLGDHLGDLLLGHAVAQELHVLRLGLRGLVQALLQLRDAPVGELAHLRQVPGAARRVHLHPSALELLLDVLRPLQARLLALPDLLQVGVLALGLADLLLERRQALAGGLVALLAQGLALHLELDEAPVEPVHLLGLGVHLHADAARGLVHQVDGLVRQLAVADVAVREGGRGDDRRVGDVHAVVDLVALLQAAQDGDGVLDVRLAHVDLLEAALEGGVLLHVLAVLVERGGADGVQLAPGERRLQHVAGVHRALGLAGADHRVQLVDEQDDLPFLLGEVLQHRLQPLLELAPELRARDERAHVEGEHALVLEALGDLAVDDALGEPLDDGGLAHAGLADQDGVVLGAALQDLDGAPDLVVAPDDRVELARFGALGEVDGVLLERLAALLGVRILHPLAAPGLVDGALQGVAGEAGRPQDLAEPAPVLESGQREELARDVLVLPLLGELVGEVEQLAEVVRGDDLAPRALHPRQAVQGLGELVAQRRDVDPGLGEERAHGAPLLVEQGGHHVHRLQVLVIATHGEALGVGQGRLEPGRQLVHPHRHRSSTGAAAALHSP